MENTEQLEQDAEGHRANVESTLDQLKDRMSVDQIVGDVGRFLGMSDPAANMRSIGNHVKANPVAIGMVGVGLAWLLMGGRDTQKPPTQWSNSQWKGNSDKNAWDARVSDFTGKAEDQLSSVSDGVKDKISGMVQSTRSHLEDGIEKLSETSGSIRHSLASRLEDQPMLVGGLAVILGTIVGAVLPKTLTENALMGEQRDHLLNEAKHATSALRDRAVDAAQHTFDTAVDSARDEGLLPHGDETLVSRVGAVAGAAIDEAKRQIEPFLDGEDPAVAKS